VLLIKIWSFAKQGVDFRSDWALCSCRFAFAQSKASWGRPMSRFTRVARSMVSSVTLIPKESLSLHSNQPIHLACISYHVILIYSDKTETLAKCFLCAKHSTNKATAMARYTLYLV